MFAVQLAELLGDPPAGVPEALDLVAGFDAALVSGLGRLTPEHAAALTGLAGAVAASPLGPGVGEAAEKLVAGSVTDERLAAVAGARGALLGAVHDAQLAALDSALGRDREPWAEPPPAEPVADRLLDGSRSWLRELALVGWRGLDDDSLRGVDQALAALWAEPAARRLAVLLDGLAAELRACAPLATWERLPVRRWADLWAGALLLSQPGARLAAGEPLAEVTGRLLPLGTELHEHDTAVQLVVHALLETGGDEPARLVRVAVGAAKVETISGPTVWQLLTGYPVLLRALAERRAVTVSGLSLLAGGDLRWDESGAALAEPADPFVTARTHLAGARAAAVPPLRRHPVQLAEPVLLEGYRVKDGALTLDGHVLPLELDQLPAGGPLTPQLVKASTACLGLLRWEAGGWSLRPLGVRAVVRKEEVDAHTGDWAQGPTDPKVAKAEAKWGDAVGVLRERAGRLLRS
ncbi:hypothetical protein RM844_19580 [Streptomyces sp. DSM 44915]|uniref:Uncharacterized protein n=1 Tax=Streptomyces chisholmiae TaxID=3075540 RepID=A0ABU2JU54_9ACTN|nr:hypothetical protein [Streptomyces sp. DSM 44915]MDT0268490.1 hypothetical protein [Streptomyces sp. DSM 44915]